MISAKQWLKEISNLPAQATDDSYPLNEQQIKAIQKDAFESGLEDAKRQLVLKLLRLLNK